MWVIIAIRSNASRGRSVGSAHAAFRRVVVVSSGDGIEVVVLESLLVLGTLHELGNRVLDGLLATWEIEHQDTLTHTSHQLEDRGLSLLEKLRDLLKTVDHRTILSNGFRHSGCELVAKQVVDVEFAW